MAQRMETEVDCLHNEFAYSWFLVSIKPSWKFLLGFLIYILIHYLSFSTENILLTTHFNSNSRSCFLLYVNILQVCNSLTSSKVFNSESVYRTWQLYYLHSYSLTRRQTIMHWWVKTILGTIRVSKIINWSAIIILCYCTGFGQLKEVGRRGLV